MNEPPVNESDVRIAYTDAKSKYPDATADVERGIRSARAAAKNDPFDTFDWFVHKSETFDYAGRPAVKCMRVYARKKRLFRNSGLYDMAGNIVPGLWSF